MKLILKNSDLVFKKRHIKNVVYKNYLIRQTGQWFDFSPLLPESFQLVKLSGQIDFLLSADLSKTQLLIGNANSVNIFANAKSLYFRQYGDRVSHSYAVDSVPAEIVALFDNTAGTVSFNSGETESYSSVIPSSLVLSSLLLFATSSGTAASNLSGIKYKRISLTNNETGELIMDIRPAIVDGVPCLYDSVSETEIFSKDGTEIVVSD